MTIEYTVLDPTGNITILVTSPVPEEDQPSVAKKLMELEPSAEQVGFVSGWDGSSIRLRMAGGEFCGNASMSAAALCVKLDEDLSVLSSDHQVGRTVTVYVYGTEKPVRVVITGCNGEKDTWSGAVAMPEPVSAGTELLPFEDGVINLPVVRFPGITHVIIKDGPDEIKKGTAEELAYNWCSWLDADALGIMFLNSVKNTMKPLVYVPAADTVFWESSCASGTTAAGAYLAAEQGDRIHMSLRQPGGTLEITADSEGELILAGTVRIVSGRTVII